MYPLTWSLLVFFLAFAVGCSHQRVQTQRPTDLRLTCQELQMEMVRAEEAARDVDNKTGFSGRNVGLALLFWPGVVVNEVQGSKALDSVEQRIAHLNGLYAKNGCAAAKD